LALRASSLNVAFSAPVIIGTPHFPIMVCSAVNRQDFKGVRP
jgi:hypothetical protein